MESIQENLLSDLESNLVVASKGQRFLNYIIDFICFLVVLFTIGVVIGIMNPSLIDGISNMNPLMDRLFTLFFFGIFMGSIEAISKGRSLGKLITGTKAVNQDGTIITPATAFARGFCRAVPFNPLSALGNPSYPWHDKWTKTYVIDIKDSLVLNK
ncbi:MAG: RDD family protein [Chitinophagaceae bacterium]